MTIRVTNVTKQFGDFYALKNVSVDIPSGSLTALLGPSGGGKSTLLRVIAGLEQPDAGSVEISGEDLTTTPPQGRNVGFVFQHYAAFKHLTVARNVAFGLEIRKRPKVEVQRRVQELLELVHLENFAHRYPAQLSGGQRQRMALARALAVEPRVLLLDEPFGALDAQVRKELRTWLRRLHDEVHVTTVFVTHDQEEAMDVADRIFVMANGQVEQTGSPDELYDRPANDFVMSFLGPATRLDGQLVRPHDVELLADPQPGAVRAHITRIVRLGFEVRVELTPDGVDGDATRSGLLAAADAVENAGGKATTADSGALWAQLTREELQRLGLGVGDAVFARPARHALAKAL
jgi:sulfate transport system ATP-binding protein